MGNWHGPGTNALGNVNADSIALGDDAECRTGSRVDWNDLVDLD
ncbi:MAG TPA: hypothetical protein VGL34_15210 [Steroidobacteraceae bacterium]|jgi:hypothetical protein